MMKKIKYIYMLLALIGAIGIPARSSAQAAAAELPLGALHFVTMREDICTCDGNTTWVLNYVTDSMLTLYEEPDSIIYDYDNIDYGTYEFGSYRIGAQPCSINTGEGGCVDLVNDATYGMLPGTGTSLVRSNISGVPTLFQPYQPTKTLARNYFDSIKHTTKGIMRGLSF